MAKPLSNIFKKTLFFKWKDEHHRAFKDLKQRFSFALMLKFINFTKLFKIHTNGRRIFMQKRHLIALENKKFYGAQLRWSIHEKKLYVIIVCCLKTWKHLGTHKTKIFIDNISLRYFKT
jgi:hypothetical protein